MHQHIYKHGVHLTSELTHHEIAKIWVSFEEREIDREREREREREVPKERNVHKHSPLYLLALMSTNDTICWCYITRIWAGAERAGVMSYLAPHKLQFGSAIVGIMD